MNIHDSSCHGLILRLHLLAIAVNYSSHSTLVPSHGDDKCSLNGMLDMNKHSPAILVLNSIASLLVCNKEVVAVAGLHLQPDWLGSVTQNEQTGDQGKEESGKSR